MVEAQFVKLAWSFCALFRGSSFQHGGQAGHAGCGQRGFEEFASFHSKRSAFWREIEVMNQIGTPLPALSPPCGERVAEGRERGGSGRAFLSPASRRSSK